REARVSPPHPLVNGGGLDTVVAPHHEAVDIGPGMTLRGDPPGLLGMPGIHLLDRDIEPEPRTAGLMRPHALHLGHAGGFELIPNRAAAISAPIERVVVGRDARDRAEQDRVVPVHQALDADGRLLLEPPRLVAGPLAERTLVD